MIRTDHKALVNAIENGTGEHSLNEQRMINYITEYGPVMKYLAGRDNPVADGLSRPHTISKIRQEEWTLPTAE